jgi:succinylglutamic semialdehyde dehydrogenase
MSRSELVSIDPCTQEIVWQGAVAEAKDVAAAVANSRKAFQLWSRISLETRIAVVQAFRDHVTTHADMLARLISRETGKPFWEAKTEVASVAGKVDISIKAYTERTGTTAVPAGAFQQTLTHRPHGVLVVLGPYNFPAHLPNGHIVPALLAGNTILFKPSELTPAVAFWMAEAWQAAGLPAHVLQIMPGARATGEALTQSHDIDGVLFTGSATTGVALHRQFAGQPEKMLALEMGGNNPLLVWDVASAENAAHVIVQSAFQSAGQRCTCARRLILPEGRAGRDILDAVTAVAARLIVDAPFADPQPFMGPVISNAAADGLQRAYDTLLSGGGKILMALTRQQSDLPFLTPAIVDVTSCNTVTDDEYFGPLLQVIRAPDFNAAIEQANATRFGLAAGLLSDNASLFDAFSAQARAGIVNWNRPLTGASSAAPFGGIGLSGNYRPSAYYAADYCAYPQAGLSQDSLAGQHITTGLKP